MKTKNFIVEVIENADEKRYFIVRELMSGNLPPKTVLVADDSNDVAQFLIQFDFEC